MKKNFIIIIVLLGIVCRGFCQPQIGAPSFPGSVNLFDKFEVSLFVSNNYSNPYDSAVIFIEATFISPDNNSYQVSAFYYEGYTFTNSGLVEQAQRLPEKPCWKIRFTPNQVGTWTFTIQGTDAYGTTYLPNNGIGNYTFICNSVSNADGIISKANTRFLKRDVVRNGQRMFKSFFPVGLNIAWYSCSYDINHNPVYTQPYGIYDYKRYIDSLSGKINYMRIFLNRYQYLSLYGPEYASPDAPIVYFDSTVNQKDSAELDYIVEYAAQHGITIMPCIFSYGDFSTDPPVDHSTTDSCVWRNNPFHTQLRLEEPCEFFYDVSAKRITSNLIRYIISRWGYATNIMCWELWNEVSNMFKVCDGDTGDLQQNVLSWHIEMANKVRTYDPYKRCVSTSMGTTNKTYSTSLTNYNFQLYLDLFDTLDIAQRHSYHNIQKAKSTEQISKILFDSITRAHSVDSLKLFFMGEFGFGQSHPPYYAEKDSCGIDLHNSLWSSLFSTAIGPAALWWWDYIKSSRLYDRFAPLLTFCQNLPIFSDNFSAHQTGDVDGHKLVFTNNIQTYYMINAAEDTIYGWCQDTTFAYQSLRWLTDSVRPHTDSTGYGLHFVDSVVFDTMGYVYKLTTDKRPNPSSSSNVISIPISNQPVGTIYSIIWYNTETRLPYSYNYTVLYKVHLNNLGEKVLNIGFPSEIRDIKHNTISNTFGDAVFSLIKYDGSPFSKKTSLLLE